MEPSAKTSIKMTTGMQFRQLVSCMEQFPHLATGAPQFGSSKATMECTWDTVAIKVNAYGPPLRTGNEWKKVWIDLKGRLKKKVAENNKCLKETGGGPCRVNNLTDLEMDIDRICHISAAAAPSGKVFGVTPVKQSVTFITPPRKNLQVAVVTPTSANCPKSMEDGETFPRNWVACDDEFDNLPSTSQGSISYRMSTPKPAGFNSLRPNSQGGKPTSTPKSTELPNRKRKHSEMKASEGQERLDLLRQQSESAKEVVAAVKECTEAIKAQAESLQAISSSMQLLTKSIVDILWHISEK